MLDNILMSKDEVNRITHENIKSSYDENNNKSINSLIESILIMTSYSIKNKSEKGEFGCIVRNTYSLEESKIIDL